MVPGTQQYSVDSVALVLHIFRTAGFDQDFQRHTYFQYQLYIFSKFVWITLI